jgi:uncharacterized protein YbgA (DUF1722 family)/uncharacterized protein YbbK (DUF523 family)
MPAAPLWQDTAPIRVGISTCLLGEPVRYDGGHKRDRYLTDVLGRYFEWVPVCPEVEVGMGTPRPAIRLVRGAGPIRENSSTGSAANGPRLVEPKEGRDHTRAMVSFARKRVRALAALDLCGYVLKSGSPSCGMERVKVWSADGTPEKIGTGVFAAELQRRLPTLPVEEEGRLHDARIRESWIERVFAYRRLRTLHAARFSRGRLVAFHTAHKLQLLSHSETHYRALGRLVAAAKGIPDAELRERYESGFMAALAKPATARRHANVLQHALGHLRGKVEPAVSRELLAGIEDYARGLVPLVVPLTMLSHYVKRLGIAYLAGQVYLDPHPKELMLRNQV